MNLRSRRFCGFSSHCDENNKAEKNEISDLSMVIRRY